MNELKDILVGIELHPKRAEVTTGSRNACTQASWLAVTSKARVVLLHSTWREAGGVRELSSERRAALEELLAELEGRGVNVRLEVSSERPWLAITRAVLRGEADLVVVGKRDETVTEGRRLGNVSTKLLRKCPCAVWVVRPEHDLVHKLVLSATDLTPVGDRAVEYGAYVAERHGAELHVVHAYQISMELQLEASRLPEQEYAERLDSIRSAAQAHIDEVITRSEYDGESAVHVGRNAPFIAIREAVEHFHPDLLVMGTISRGGLPGLLVGNTAERILDRVDCSVLTVKPHDFVCPVTLE